ncbi:hypothetical protein GJ496_005892 [Pomphorhynchus laevis]|nr:hypothetical protein GJ496_005892 [Pomphorhynchus laevis]
MDLNPVDMNSNRGKCARKKSNRKKRQISPDSYDDEIKVDCRKLKKATQGIQAKQNLRSSKGLTGLVNLGNTCYMNVVIQVLCHIKEFCDSICSMSFDYPELPPRRELSYSGRVIKYGLRGGSVHKTNEQDIDADITICHELHSAFNIIWSGYCPLYSPIGMRQAVLNQISDFDGNEQHDAHEFLVILLNYVHEEMVNIHKICPSAVEHCFLGRLTCQIDSKFCPLDSSTVRAEDFHELSLGFNKEDIEKGRSKLMSNSYSYNIYDMLDHFSRWEFFRCKKCTTMCCRKRLFVHKFPRILRIHINRFCWIKPSQSLAKTESGSCKINWHVEFPEILTLSEILLNNKRRVQFRLLAVIVHDGLHFDRGHYKSYFYLDTEKCWIMSNDKEIAKVDISEVLSGQAYILFYRLLN